MNRHLAIKMSCFCVLELRNSPAITRIPRLESEYFNHNLFDPDLIRGSLNELYAAYLEWADEPTQIFKYRQDEENESIPSELDVLCYQSTEEDECIDEEYVFFLVTAGMSTRRMHGPIEYAELLLQIKGKKYVKSLEALSCKLAEFAVLPFRHETYFSPNRLIDNFAFPLFNGMETVLLTHWGGGEFIRVLALY